LRRIFLLYKRHINCLGFQDPDRLHQCRPSAIFWRSFAELQPQKNCALGNARIKFAIFPNCRTAPHPGSEKTAEPRTTDVGVSWKLRNCDETPQPPTKLQKCRKTTDICGYLPKSAVLQRLQNCRTADSAISSETVEPQNCRIIRISRNHISRRNCAVAQPRNRRTAELQLCFADGRHWSS
jgi:hypothetical protein